MKIRSRILGTGSYLPPNIWKNNDLTKLMETSDEWIQQRTGIKQRHWASDNQTTTDLALEASRKAIQSAGIAKEDLDMIIFATLSPDHEFPGNACFLQAKLGVPGIAALDIRQQCSGFIYGLSIADQFVRSGMRKNVLVVGAELHSRGLDRTTRGRDVTVLFGDGAGAVVVGPTEDKGDRTSPGIYSTHLHADGNFAKELWTPAPGMGMGVDCRINSQMINEAAIYPQMNGKAVFVHASKRMPEAVMEALGANGYKPQDVDLYVFHQANLRINEMVAKQLEIPENKVFNTIDRFANTTAATIPIGLDVAVQEGRLKPGMLVATAAFGSGFTWGSALLRW
jgi:3-oxoacyl-[acyl-carrier-protein] synthase-3